MERPQLVRRQTINDFREVAFLTREEQIKLGHLQNDVRQVKSEIVQRHSFSPKHRRRKSAAQFVEAAVTVKRDDEVQEELLELISLFEEKGILKDASGLRTALEQSHKSAASVLDAISICIAHESLEDVVVFAASIPSSAWDKEAVRFVACHDTALDFTKLCFDKYRAECSDSDYLRDDSLACKLSLAWLERAAPVQLSCSTRVGLSDLVVDIVEQCLRHWNGIDEELMQMQRYIQSLYTGKSHVALVNAFLRYYCPRILRLTNPNVSRIVQLYISGVTPRACDALYIDRLRRDEDIQRLRRRAYKRLRPV